MLLEKGKQYDTKNNKEIRNRDRYTVDAVTRNRSSINLSIATLKRPPTDKFAYQETILIDYFYVG